MTIGEIIKRKRNFKQWTMKKLADKCGVTIQVVFRWEHEEVYPSLLNAITLADVFDCTLDELVGRIRKEV